MGYPERYSVYNWMPVCMARGTADKLFSVMQFSYRVACVRSCSVNPAPTTRCMFLKLGGKGFSEGDEGRRPSGTGPGGEKGRSDSRLHSPVQPDRVSSTTLLLPCSAVIQANIRWLTDGCLRQGLLGGDGC